MLSTPEPDSLPETTDAWPSIVADRSKLSIRELAAKYEIPAGLLSAAFRRTGTSREHVFQGSLIAA